MCGEQNLVNNSDKELPGSPPRVRGAVTIKVTTPSEQRITPACAGSRLLYRRHHSKRRDHPRVCGEQSHHILKMLLYQGSPPRVRGAEGQELDERRVQRITPACAGSSCPGLAQNTDPSDHPRVCGEQTKRSLIISDFLIPGLPNFNEFFI